MMSGWATWHSRRNRWVYQWMIAGVVAMRVRTHGVRGVSLVVGALVALLGVVGCSSGSPSGSPSASKNPLSYNTIMDEKGAEPASAEQEAVLADGNVTYDEYKSSFQRFVSCVKQGGYEINLSGEENQVQDYSVPSGAVDDGIDLKCYTKEFANIDMWWQGDRRAVAENPLILACLQKLGVEPEQVPSTATRSEKLLAWSTQLDKAGSSRDKCVGTDG